MTRTPARVIQEPRCLSKARTYDPLIKSHYIRAETTARQSASKYFAPPIVKMFVEGASIREIAATKNLRTERVRQIIRHAACQAIPEAGYTAFGKLTERVFEAILRNNAYPAYSEDQIKLLAGRGQPVELFTRPRTREQIFELAAIKLRAVV